MEEGVDQSISNGRLLSGAWRNHEDDFRGNPVPWRKDGGVEEGGHSLLSGVDGHLEVHT